MPVSTLKNHIIICNWNSFGIKIIEEIHNPVHKEIRPIVVISETADEIILPDKNDNELFNDIYLIKGDPFWQKNDEEIENEFLSALESMYPLFRKGDVLCFKTSKASHVHPITTLHYSTSLLPPTRTSVEHVFVVNSAQIPNGTMNVNEIVGLANRKAKELVELLSK